MKRKIIFIYILCIILGFVWLHSSNQEALPNKIMGYYNTYAYRDTAALNFVTAIYLNYRVYDTLFEALMLLISIIGVIYFSKHEGGR